MKARRQAGMKAGRGREGKAMEAREEVGIEEGIWAGGIEASSEGAFWRLDLLASRGEVVDVG